MDVSEAGKVSSLSHWPGDHVTHLENVSEDEMSRLLGIVLDVEYLYTCVHKEEDADTKQVYFSLFKVTHFHFSLTSHSLSPLFILKLPSYVFKLTSTFTLHLFT